MLSKVLLNGNKQILLKTFHDIRTNSKLTKRQLIISIWWLGLKLKSLNRDLNWCTFVKLTADNLLQQMQNTFFP